MKRSVLQRLPRELIKSIDSAIECLSGPDGISDQAAHAARKSLKRARAALRLLRPGLGTTFYRRENALLRDVSRRVSPLRDAKAQIDSFTFLRDRYLRIEAVLETSNFDASLRDELIRKRRMLSGSSPALHASLRMLMQSLKSIRALGSLDSDTHVVRAGLRKIYRQGQRAFSAARQRPTSVLLHDWRKKAKYLANAVDVMGDDAGSKRIRLAKHARRVAGLLGEEHDLATLTSELAKRKHALGSAARNELLAAIRDRRATLQAKSLQLGTRIYATK